MENNRIKELELQMEELKLKMDVEIIRPYLISKGLNLTPKHKCDLASYYVARRGNLRYLAFGILRYDTSLIGSTNYKKGDCGQIVYATKAPKTCATCLHSQSYQEIMCDCNYQIDGYQCTIKRNKNKIN